MLFRNKNKLKVPKIPEVQEYATKEKFTARFCIVPPPSKNLYWVTVIMALLVPLTGLLAYSAESEYSRFIFASLFAITGILVTFAFLFSFASQMYNEAIITITNDEINYSISHKSNQVHVKTFGTTNIKQVFVEKYPIDSAHRFIFDYAESSRFRVNIITKDGHTQELTGNIPSYKSARRIEQIIEKILNIPDQVVDLEHIEFDIDDQQAA